MLLPDLNEYGWPDLDDAGRFPPSPAREAMDESVETGVANPPIPRLEKPCYPAPLPAVVPFAYPTLTPTKVTPARLGVKSILPIIPSLGVHCPTLQSKIDISVGDIGSFQRSIGTKEGDSCLPVIQDLITFPCTSVKAQVESMAGEFREIQASFGGSSNRRTGSQCIQDLLLQIGGPGCTDILSSTVIEMTTGGDASFERSMGRRVNGCGLAMQDHITIPCISPTLLPGAIRVTSGSAAGGVMRVLEQGNPCDRTFKLDLDLAVPCVTPTLVPGTVAVYPVKDPKIDGEVGGSMQITQTGPPCDRTFQFDLLLRVPNGASGGGTGTPGVFVTNRDPTAAPTFRDDPCTSEVFMPGQWGLAIQDTYGVLGGKPGDVYGGVNGFGIVNLSGVALQPGDPVNVTSRIGIGDASLTDENFGTEQMRQYLSALAGNAKTEIQNAVGNVASYMSVGPG